MLRRLGIDLPDTRAWRLETVRERSPFVEALLEWRKAERIATTFGYGWLERHVGADGRLRGEWSASDGAAGRMTAQAGLHNMPAELRVAVAAEPGHVLVRADLGQIEPRVLAAVSGDPALALATADDDLYAPVALRLGVERPVAKVAVLAAMYGQTSGSAGQALRSMELAYPVALQYLRDAEESGRVGVDVRTRGGRLVRMWATGDEMERGRRAQRPRRSRSVRAQRRGAGRGRRAVQGVGRHRARPSPAARCADRAVPARRAARPRARRARRRGRRRGARCPRRGGAPLDARHAGAVRRRRERGAALERRRQGLSECALTGSSAAWT